MEQLNPELVKHAEPMAQAHSLRQRLRLLGDYLLSCRSGACKKLQARCVYVCESECVSHMSMFLIWLCILLAQNGAAHLLAGVEPSVQRPGPTTGTLLCYSSLTMKYPNTCDF